MPSIVSQFGAASLAVQEELRRSIRRGESVPRAANLILLSLDGDVFATERGGTDPERIEVFRREMLHEIVTFVASNEWGLTGPVSLQLLLRPLDRPCSVRAIHVDALFDLAVRDDRGERSVPVKQPSVIIGRAHGAPPRAFVPVYDGSRSLSREHLLLVFADLDFRLTLMGRNATTLNGELLRNGVAVPVVPGDTVACGPHTISIGELRF